MDLYELTSRLEERTGFDPAIEALEHLVPPVLRRGRWRDVLAGRPLGHALHPPMTDVPIGAWVSATVLDLLAAERWRWPSATLTWVGLAAAIPTIASGVVEWVDTRPREKRVAVVHAAANAAATASYVVSFVAKLAGRTRLGRTASLTGVAFAGLGGYLGGHLAFARGAGVDRAIDRRSQTNWFAVEVERNATASVVPARESSGDAFLIVREGATSHAVLDRCTRCGGSLQTAPEGVLACRHDASRFEIASGRVILGPATTPLVTFDVDETRSGTLLRRR